MTMTNTDFDAIVVGSGITGGWAAKELTERGFKVLMIERGRMIEHQTGYDTETKAPWEMPFRGQGDASLYAREYAIQRGNRAFDEWTQGHFVNDLENPYSSPADSGFQWWRSYQLGGRSLTWGRQCYRWSDHDFGANKADGHGIDWPIRYVDLAHWYDHVEEFVGVSGSVEGIDALPDGRFLPPMDLNVVEKHTKDVIEARWPERKLIIGRTANLTEARPEQGRAHCQYRSICARGCSYGAYFSTQSATLPAARKTGRLTLVTDAIVERVETDPKTKRAIGVVYIDTTTKTKKRATARLVFLNAGAFNSVALLLRSGIANSSGVLGTHVMDHANTLAAVAIMPGFQEHTTLGNRPTGIVIPRYRNLTPGESHGFTRGYSYQGGALQGGWTQGKREAGLGKDFKAKLRPPGMWRMVLVTYAESLPRPTNRLTLNGRQRDDWGMPLLDIDFKHGANEQAALKDAVAEGKAMLQAAGGMVIVEGDGTPGPGGTAIHEMGGARMGDDPRVSVLDRWSAAHDVPNLFVTDGAQMNSSACQNPSLTYMALTARAVDHAVQLAQQGTL
jgi:choline dehydrogenase-like flavoprotein